MNLKITIIKGDKNQGKTTLIKSKVANLLAQGKHVVGFYSEKIIHKEIVIGYDLVTIPQMEKISFLRIDVESSQKIGPFYINNKALNRGLSQIKMAIKSKVAIIVLDEVGKLELNDKGWAIGIQKLINEFEGEIILSVRAGFVEQVIVKWNLVGSHVKIIEL